ncbi:polysaccharide biosynthesis/export family protein [Cereibacter sp. SYSU M97828]|nr:polysaccharide biosynthesis/export family protein [Cereibacter flavus]
MFKTFAFLASTLSPAKFLSAGLAAALLASPALAQSGYQLQPGDVVRVEVLEDPALNRSTLVLPDGSINFPQAGAIRAAGLSVEQVQSALSNALSANFATPPTVYASVASLAPPPLPSMGGAAASEEIVNGIKVYVMGEVSEPGLKEVEAGTNLLQFMAQAGNVGNFAARKRIELHRMDAATGTGRIYVFDLNKVGGGANRISGMTQLVEGDVVVVPQRRLFE